MKFLNNNLLCLLKKITLLANLNKVGFVIYASMNSESAIYRDVRQAWTGNYDWDVRLIYVQLSEPKDS